MALYESIAKRRSVRTFDGKMLRNEDLEKITTYASEASNPYGIPIEWRVLDPKKEGLRAPVIVDAPCYIAGKLSRVPHAEEAFGYTFEKILLYAYSLGVGSTWIAGTMNRPAFEQAMDLSAEQVMPCVSPLGYPADKMSLRETMMRKAIHADQRLDFGSLFFDGSFAHPLSPAAAGDLSDAFNAVRLSPSAVNKQPWRAVLMGNKVAFYEKQSGGYVTESGWDLQKVDLGIALCHFALAAEAAGRTVTLVSDDPHIETPSETFYIATFILE